MWLPNSYHHLSCYILELLHYEMLALVVSLSLVHLVLGVPDCCSTSNDTCCMEHCQSQLAEKVSAVNRNVFCFASTAIIDCCDVFLLPGRRSGVYWQGEEIRGAKVLCNMESSGG